jgi:hypothetical protein
LLLLNKSEAQHSQFIPQSAEEVRVARALQTVPLASSVVVEKGNIVFAAVIVFCCWEEDADETNDELVAFVAAAKHAP